MVWVLLYLFIGFVMIVTAYYTECPQSESLYLRRKNFCHEILFAPIIWPVIFVAMLIEIIKNVHNVLKESHKNY